MGDGEAIVVVAALVAVWTSRGGKGRHFHGSEKGIVVWFLVDAVIGAVVVAGRLLTRQAYAIHASKKRSVLGDPIMLAVMDVIDGRDHVGTS